MKFLCPSCKAKYQIADEKVIGRTVKMKCRHCGHLIEINEAVTGNVGQSDGPPPEVIDLGTVSPPKVVEQPNESRSRESLSVTRQEGLAKSKVPLKSAQASLPTQTSRVPPTAKLSATPGPRVGAPPERSRTVAATVPRPATVRSTAIGVVAPLKPASVVAPPKPASVVAPPKPASAVAPPKPASAAASPKPASAVAPPKPAPIAAPSVSPSPPQRKATNAGDGAPPSSSRTGSAATVKRLTPSSGSSRAGVVSSTASIGRLPGVPETVASSLGAGVAKAAVAHQDALAGAFTKAVSEVSAQTEAEHPLAGDEWYVGINDVPIGPIRLVEIRDRAAQGEVTQECLVWRDGFEDWKPLSAFPELVAIVEEGIASFRSLRPAPVVIDAGMPAAPAHRALMHPEPAAPVATIPAAAAPVVLDEEALAISGLPKQKIPLAAWLAVAAALALGITIGLVLIKPEPPKQVVKYVEVPVTSKPVGVKSPGLVAAANAPQAGDETIGDQDTAQKQNGTSVRKVAASGSGDSATTNPSPNEISQGLKGLQGLQAVGPRTGPTSEVGSSAGARQQLDSATLSRTVSRYTASVKRSCWQPALDARAPDAATSARISANIVVAPNGKVHTVTVSPDPKGYRGLSSCIQARVRNWEFPSASGQTEFNVPFVFAAQ